MRIAKTYPRIANQDDIFKGAPITATGLSGIIQPHLHQSQFLCLHSAACDCSYMDTGIIESEPGFSNPHVELVFKAHPRCTAVALVMRAQIADSSDNPSWLRAELYSAPTPSNGNPYAWTLGDSGIEWSMLGGSLQSTDGDHGVFYSAIISSGFERRAQINNPDTPRPLIVPNNSEWLRIVLYPYYARIVSVSAIELFQAEVTN